MASLDDEIEELRERAAVLRKQLQVQTSTLLAAPATRQLLADTTSAKHEKDRRLRAAAEAHAAHQQQSLYRAGASVTAFRVRDPDPHAVDGGRVLGLRFDTMVGAQFLRPYYVLLHRDERRGGQMRVHRHTVPPAVPLGGLAKRHLQAPADKTLAKTDIDTDTNANDTDAGVYAFACAVRRALVRYHNRLAVIGDLQQAMHAAEAERQARAADETFNTVANTDALDLPVAVSGADAEGKQIRFDWADGRTGRLVLDDDGGLGELVVVGAGVRDQAAARALLGPETTALGLVRRVGGT